MPIIDLTDTQKALLAQVVAEEGNLQTQAGNQDRWLADLVLSTDAERKGRIAGWLTRLRDANTAKLSTLDGEVAAAKVRLQDSNVVLDAAIDRVGKASAAEPAVKPVEK